jgi:8-oxo-dGTP pyrophosphatase MutT (NUDIX family)
MIKHRVHDTGRSYWVFPGGGIEPGETDEECVRREMKQETNLDVRIVSLLLDEIGHPGGVYKYLNTYLCESTIGEPSPGIEPEPEVSSRYSIIEVKWFDLRREARWDSELITDPFTYDQLQRVRKALGYLPRPFGCIALLAFCYF